MVSRSGVLSAFSTDDIFNVGWVYQDVTPLKVEGDLCFYDPRFTDEETEAQRG